MRFVLVLIACLTAFVGAYPASQAIQNDVFWKDLSGKPIYSQGGGVLKVKDTYYWYGAHYKEAESYFSNPAKHLSATTFSSVTCYSSDDLVNWKFEGDVFTGQSGWVGRMGVAYNAATKKYVLVSQGGGGILFATSDSPNGKFTLDNIQDSPPGIANGMTGDQTVFNDDDGKAYLICSSASGRGNLYVAPLRAADYLKVEQATRIFGGVGREGNCMFKYRGRYYFCSSDLHGWNASHCYYISSANIMGPYSSEKIMTTTDFDFCHVTQTGFFITVSGSKDTTVLFCGDRWCDFAGNGIGYNQWCPLSFNGIDAVFNSVTQFNLDAAAGSWSTGAGNNYILNPGFEADRITQTELAGWTNSKGATSIGNASGAHSGNFCIQLTSASAYADTVYQDIKQIPNGTYTLKAWVKSSGGQTACKVFISDFGSAEMSSDISKSMNAWTQISITGIKITNGKCRVGIASDAKADNNCRADDFLLVNASPDAVVAGTALVLALPSENGFIKAVSGRPFTLPLVNGHSAMRLFVYDLSGKRIGMVATRSRVIDLEKECRTAPGTYLVKIAKSAVTCSQANKPLLLRCSESREFDAP